MNDQTSPTADGQGPGSSPWRNPFEEPQNAHGLPGVPGRGPGAPGASGPVADQVGAGFGPGPGGGAGAGAPERRPLSAVLLAYRPDLLVAVILLVTGAVLGVLAGLAWYRLAPTVWLTLPASAVPQVTSGVDQSALLVSPEGKGIASVDGYYFVFTAIVGLLLGIFGFFLARRGFVADRDEPGPPEGAGVGAWAGVLLGGLAASTVAAALGRWVSMPDPLTVLHTIAAGHNFHAPVALHAQGLYLAAPLLGLVLFLALTAAFTKPTPPTWKAYADLQEQGYFSTGNPYGFPGGAEPQEQPQLGPPPQEQPQPPEQNGQAGGGHDNGPDATPGANSSVQQTDTPLG